MIIIINCVISLIMINVDTYLIFTSLAKIIGGVLKFIKFLISSP